MGGTPPRTSVGLPVRNGASYLREALDSLMCQTVDDFEVIVSDNASADETPALCREYAERYERIRYVRFDTNVGAARNFNHAFEQSRGRYFKWMAADDLCAPDFLERCTSVLDEDSRAVLCYPNVRDVDQWGRPKENRSGPLHEPAYDLPRRFWQYVFADHNRHSAGEIFGVIRSEVLAETGLIPTCAHGDRLLLARLSLRGRFRHVPENLLFRRTHAERSVHRRPAHVEDGSDLLYRILGPGPLPPAEWFDPSLKNQVVYPEWRRLRELVRSIRSSELDGWTALSCLAGLLAWTVWNTPRLGRDLVVGIERHLRSANVLSPSGAFFHS